MDGVLFLLGKQKQGMKMLGNRISLPKFRLVLGGRKILPRKKLNLQACLGGIHLVETVILVKDITNGDKTRKVVLKVQRVGFLVPGSGRIRTVLLNHLV
ncbi:hypothetical protein TB2_039817 [Malus domestica]